MSEAKHTEQVDALRRFKPYQAYKDSGVEWLGEIPAGWEVKRLKNCVQRLESGGTPESANFDYWTDDESGTPWVAISDMTRGFHVRDTAKRVTERGRRSKRLPLLPAGTLLYSMYASLGKVALLEIDAVVNQAILGLVTRDELVSRDYLRWWLEFMQGHVHMLSSSNTQDNLNADKVRKMPVFAPGPDVQPGIAAFLDRETARIDALVAKNERLIELLQEQRTALITRAVTKGLDPNVPLKDSGVEWLGEIPTHWESRPLKVQCDIRGRIGYRGYAVDDIVPEGQGAITLSPGNIREDGLDLSECTYLSWDKYRESPEIQIEPRDIILTKTGSTLGKGAIVARCDEPMTINPQLVILRHREVTSAEFLAYILRCDGMKDLYWLENSGGATPTVSQQKVGKFSVPVPPLREQGGIAHFLDREILKIDALIANVRDVINRLKELRTALICAAVTGKVDVREEVA